MVLTLHWRGKREGEGVACESPDDEKGTTLSGKERGRREGEEYVIGEGGWRARIGATRDRALRR